MPDSPARVRFSNAAQMLWADGTAFNGFAVFTLTYPTGYAKKCKLINPNATNHETTACAEYGRINITNGYWDSDSGIWSNASINPPGTQWQINYYDESGSLLTSIDITAGGTHTWSSPYQTIGFANTSDAIIDDSFFVGATSNPPLAYAGKWTLPVAYV